VEADDAGNLPFKKKPSDWIRWARSARKVLLTILLLGITSLVIIPFLWMLLMSVKTSRRFWRIRMACPRCFGGQLR